MPLFVTITACMFIVSREVQRKRTQPECAAEIFVGSVNMLRFD